MKHLFSFLIKRFMDCHGINNDSKRDMLPSLVVNFPVIRIQTFEDNTGKTDRKIDWHPIWYNTDS